MNKKLYQIAGKAVKEVYAGKCHNIGSTEWASTITVYQGQPLQVLAIGGTNELIDWFWNFFLVSWDGVKICSYLSANMIHSGNWGAFEWIRKSGSKIKSTAGFLKRKALGQQDKNPDEIPVFIREPGMPLLIAVHSKSGPTGLYWKQRFGADFCQAFCPARGFRKSIVLENTTLIIDPDDPVPKLAALSFEHPICDRVVLPDDPGFKISDHFIDNVILYLDKTEKK